MPADPHEPRPESEARQGAAYKRWRGSEQLEPDGPALAHLTLLADHDAPSEGRAAIAGLSDWANADVVERAKLLVSETVSNAVQHAGGDEVRVLIWVDRGTIEVSVHDDGPGFTPRARPGTIAHVPGGFGLPLLDILSDGWGCGVSDDAWVWFQVVPRTETDWPPLV